MKRIISMLLCLIMVLSTVVVCVPVHVHAEEGNSGVSANSECGAEPVNVNAMDSKGVFPYVEDIVVNGGAAVEWVTWASSMGYKGMFDNKNETFAIAKANPNVGLNAAVQYKDPMYITEVVIVTNVCSVKNGTATQTHAKVEVSNDGETWTTIDVVELVDGATEAKFEVEATVSFVRATCYTTNGWFGEITEFYAYSEIGHNFDTFVEEKSTPSTCTTRGTNVFACACGAEISEPAPLHNLISETITKRPTINSTGTLEGECKDCHETIERVIPVLDIADYVTRLTADDITTSEELPADAAEDAKRNKDAIMDGKVNLDPYAGNGTYNFWFGPAGSKLTIEFNEEFILYSVVLHVYSNWSGFKIEFFSATGTEVYSYENNAYQGGQAMSFTEDLMNKKVQKVVITSLHAKNTNGVNNGGMQIFSELEIQAHKCEYDMDEATNVVEGAKCKKTFDGTCIICEWTRTGVTRDFHENELDVSETDNVSPATCVSNGYKKVICSECGTKQTIVEYATGIHDFKDAKLKYKDDKKETCGEGATAWPLCNVCGAKGEEMTFEATGNHTYADTVTTLSTYTKPGVMESVCSVCAAPEPGAEPKDAPLATLNPGFTALDYSIRRTDFLATRVSFRMDLGRIKSLEEQGYDVKVYGVVAKGDVTKEVQIYGQGATGVYSDRGEFSIVVKNATSYEDEYEYSVKMVITDVNGKAEAVTISRDMSTNNNKAVSMYDVAKYYSRKSYKDDRGDMYAAIISAVEGAE